MARFQLVDIGAHPGERVFASKERKWLPQQLRKSTAVCLITEARKAMQRIGKAAARNVYDWLTVGKAMVDAREEVFEILGTNRDDTLAYRREFGTVLKREKLHDEDPIVPDKNTRGFPISRSWSVRRR